MATPARTRWSASWRTRAATCGRPSRRTRARRRAIPPGISRAHRGSRAAHRSGRHARAFRSIGERGAISRGDLAALLGARLEPLLAAARTQPIPLMTDVRGHWAQRWILDVARAGVMEVFPNHTFQPAATVRRSDLARVVGAIHARVQAADPAAAARWRGRQVEITDVAAGNAVATPPISRSKPGIIGLDPGGAFSAARAVSGPESDCRRRSAVALTGGRPVAQPHMTALTAANQLTLLRMLLIPVLALLVLYDRMGWALIVLGPGDADRRLRRPAGAAGRAAHDARRVARSGRRQAAASRRCSCC
jgi:hypothetical protein